MLKINEKLAVVAHVCNPKTSKAREFRVSWENYPIN